MIVCVCRNINEAVVNGALKAGHTAAYIIKHYDCRQCNMCNPLIKQMYKQNKAPVAQLAEAIGLGPI